MKCLFKICTVVLLMLSYSAASAYEDIDLSSFMEIPAVLDAMYTANGESYVDDQGIKYEIAKYSGSYEVTGYEGKFSEITIPDYINGRQVLAVGTKAFSGNDRLEKVTVNVRSNILSYAFKDCKNLKTVNIESSNLKSVGMALFEGCESLEEINVIRPNDNFWSEDGVFYGKTADYVEEIMTGKTAVIAYPAAKQGEEYAIQSNNENTVEMVAYGAFDGCKYLKKVIIPSSVTVIDGYAFKQCSKLEEIVIGDNVSVIGERAFGGCSSIARIDLPKSLEYIDNYPFLGCDCVEKISIDSENKYFKVNDNVLYTYDAKELIYYPPNHAGKEYTVQDGTEKIRSGAFYRANNIETINMPDSVNNIEYIGIRACAALTELNLSVGVEMLGDEAISYCAALNEIILPVGLKSISQNAFLGCSSLGEVHIPKSVESIGSDAFSGCAKDITVIGEENSAAEAYAANKEYKFKKVFYVGFIDNDGIKYTETEPGNAVNVPQKSYFTIGGLYTDAEHKSEWEINREVTESINLYVVWTPVKYEIQVINDSIYVTPEDDNPKIIVIALYNDEGRMIGVYTQNADTPVTIDKVGYNFINTVKRADKVGVYIWSGTETAFPLGSSGKLSVNTGSGGIDAY